MFTISQFCSIFKFRLALFQGYHVSHVLPFGGFYKILGVSKGDFILSLVIHFILPTNSSGHTWCDTKFNGDQIREHGGGGHLTDFKTFLHVPAVISLNDSYLTIKSGNDEVYAMANEVNIQA